LKRDKYLFVEANINELETLNIEDSNYTFNFLKHTYIHVEKAYYLLT